MNKKNILGLLIVIAIIFFEVSYIIKTLESSDNQVNEKQQTSINEKKDTSQVKNEYTVSKNSASENVKTDIKMMKEIKVNSFDSINKGKYNLRRAIETGNLKLVKNYVNNGVDPYEIIEESMSLNAFQYTEYLIKNLDQNKNSRLKKEDLESILTYLKSFTY